MMRPLCFVLMPFGQKKDVSGSTINFDAVYTEFIGPAIEAAGMEPIRADEEMTGGIIHKPMFERLILCEFAVADLTTANANVFYELGVRHAARPWSTILIFAEGGRQLPFDVAPLRAIPYQMGPDGKPLKEALSKETLTKRLKEAQEAKTDSPIYELLDGYPDIAHEKTDVFRERVEYSKILKRKLGAARKEGVEFLRIIEKELGNISNVEAGVLIDLFLSYRAVKAWADMIALVDKMSAPLRSTVMVQEQLGLALNRAGRGDEAEKVLCELIKDRGPSSESYGILGRVYKDRWEESTKTGNKFEARGLLQKSINAYLKGFEADWRDAYPGVNVITLMELKDPPDPRREELIPIVAYAVERKMASGEPDYWDHATLLELAVLAKDQDKAEQHLSNALAAMREIWEPETTARNLRLIGEAREIRQDGVPWAKEIEDELMRRTKNGK